MEKHIAKKCNVRGCKEEAGYWIPTAKLSGDFDMKARHTFYLCSDHVAKLSEGDEIEEIHFLNPETGRIRSIEIGIYACSESCRECNS